MSANAGVRGGWVTLELMAISVQRITPTEWPLLRELRLSSLRDAPDAFGQRYEEAAVHGDDDWRANARASAAGTRRAWFIARSGLAEPVGIVQARRRPPLDCLLFSMWVAPEARRLGTGSALVDAVQHWSSAWGARRVVLWVLGTNEPALRFYERTRFGLLRDGPDAESGRAYGAFAMERIVG